MTVDIEALRDRFLNHEFEAREFEVTAQDIITFAKACGESAPRFTDPADPNFQAPPTFPSTLMRGAQLPEDFPTLEGLSLNAGKAMALHHPIRPGRLTGRSHLHDIYTKTGRSGRMIFIVSRMEFFDATGELIATSDSRQVIRSKPS
ncbi:MAG: MaoC family dehydratase N-terminal domain-containing protein [Pseudomonadota bacterium]